MIDAASQASCFGTMPFSHDIIADLDQRLRQHAADLEELGADFEPQVRVADPRYGDYQANGILPHAKRVGKNPRKLAESFLEHLRQQEAFSEDTVELSVAGPGFLNFRLTASARVSWLQTNPNLEPDVCAAAKPLSRKRVVIDFSSPNTAKQMHVGHIRSTVIGEAISRMLEYCGAQTIRDNHIGDWGTQFGILLLGIKRSGWDPEQAGERPIAELESIYRKIQAEAKEDDEVMQAARNELLKLQQGEAENETLWKRINELSWQQFENAYQQLGVRFDHVLGESFYRDRVDRVYRELLELEIAQEDEGALVVFHPEHPRFCKQPMVIRKKDGASNYASTDLATVLYRVEHFRADAIIYLTDSRQNDHFEQLFLTIRKWFQAKEYPVPELRHLTFGTILGEDGKAIKTRSGEPVTLHELLSEAIQRAETIVTEKHPEYEDSERRNIAGRIGVNALRYADLMQNRNTDYSFSWQKMLSFEGNTAPYLLYAVARIHSLFRKAGRNPDEENQPLAPLTTDEENLLARQLMSFPQAVNQALQEYEPHHICQALYELACVFSTFYNKNPIIGKEPEVENTRLLLCSRTLKTMQTGLRLLGIEPLERM